MAMRAKIAFPFSTLLICQDFGRLQSDRILKFFFGEIILPDLLTILQPTDVLLVSELSRLGRSVGQIISIVEKLIAKSVRLVAIKEGIDLAGAADLQTKVMITLFSLFTDITAAQLIMNYPHPGFSPRIKFLFHNLKLNIIFLANPIAMMSGD